MGDVGSQDGELLFCRGKGGLRRGDGCPGLRIERRGPLGILPRAIIGKGQRAIAVRVDFGEIGLRGLGMGGAARISPTLNFLDIPPWPLICEFTVLYWPDALDQ